MVLVSREVTGGLREQPAVLTLGPTLLAKATLLLSLQAALNTLSTLKESQLSVCYSMPNSNITLLPHPAPALPLPKPPPWPKPPCCCCCPNTMLRFAAQLCWGYNATLSLLPDHYTGWISLSAAARQFCALPTRSLIQSRPHGVLVDSARKHSSRVTKKHDELLQTIKSVLVTLPDATVEA